MLVRRSRPRLLGQSGSCIEHPADLQVRLTLRRGTVPRADITHLFGLDPLVLGQRLVEDGLLNGGPESEGSVVRLLGCKSTDGLKGRRTQAVSRVSQLDAARNRRTF